MRERELSCCDATSANYLFDCFSSSVREVNPVYYQVSIKMIPKNVRYFIIGTVISLYIWTPIERKSQRRLRYRLRDAKIRTTLQTSQRLSQLEQEISLIVGIPRLPTIFRIYFLISSGTHLINIISNWMLILRIEERWTGGNFLTCHMPRLVLQDGINQNYTFYFSLLFSMLHLLWRVSIVCFKKEYELNLLSFLLWNEEPADSNIIEHQDPTKARIVREIRNDILYIKFEEANRTKTLPRPHRNDQSQDQLVARVKYLAHRVGAMILIISLILWPASLRTVITEHPLLYAGCDVNLYDGSYWIRSFLSIHVTITQFFENFLCLFVPAAAVFVCVEDLMEYWKSIEVRLNVLRNKLPLYRVLSDCQSRHYNASSAFNYYVSNRILINSVDSRLVEKSAMENEILELQMLLIDFFIELKHLDGFISLMLPFGILIWFSCNGVLSMIGLQLATSTIIIRGIQIVGAVVISFICRYCLLILVKTEPAYKAISTLVAWDPSTNKRKWHYLLDHYTDRPRYGFTILYSTRIFTHITFLQVFAYTVSIIFVMETLQKH